MKIGIVGSGPWAQNYIGALTRNYRDIEIVSFSAQRAQAEVLGTRSISSTAQTLLECIVQCRPDGVIFATTPQIQAEIAPALIRSRIPVSLEKPLALNLGDLELLANSMQLGSIIYVNFPNLFDLELTRFANNIIQTPEQIEPIFIVNGGHGPFRNYMSPFDDWAPHAFSIAIEALGPLQMDRSMIRTIYNARGTIFVSELKHCKERESRLVFGNGFKRRRRIYISSQTNRVNQHDKHANSYPNGNYKTMIKANEQPLDRLVQMFISDVKAKTMTNPQIFQKALATTSQYLVLKEKCFKLELTS